MTIQQLIVGEIYVSVFSFTDQIARGVIFKYQGLCEGKFGKEHTIDAMGYYAYRSHTSGIEGANFQYPTEEEKIWLSACMLHNRTMCLDEALAYHPQQYQIF